MKKITDFFSKHQKVFIKKKGSIITLGDQENWIYFIKTGLVRYYMVSAKGSELSVGVLVPDTIFPITRILNNTQHYLLSYEAFTDVQIFRAPKKEFDEFVLEDKECMAVLFYQAASRIQLLLEKIESYIFSDVYSRIIATIIYLIDTIGVETEGKSVTIHYVFTQQDIGLLAGTSREKASLALNKLIQKKLITYNNRFIIVNDIDALISARNEG